MKFNWTDYDVSMDFVETWLDDEAEGQRGLMTDLVIFMNTGKMRMFPAQITGVKSFPKTASPLL